MRFIRLHLTVSGRPVTTVYETLADFGRYPDFSPAVRSIAVSVDPSRHQIDFRQVEGDASLFDGSWYCVNDGADTAVTFAARLDIGIPSLTAADAVEPLAARTLLESTVAMVAGLFQGDARVDDVVIQVHEPATV